MRIPVKLPGPVPTTSPPRSPGPKPARAEQLVGVGEHCGGAGRPLAEHLAVEDERGGRDRCRRVEGEDEPSGHGPQSSPASRRGLAALEPDPASLGVHVRELDAHARRRQAPARALGPLDEDDRVLEIRLERAPVGVRQLLEAIQVEVRDAVVAMPDRVRRARHRPLDAERPARAADERGLPRAELAGDVDDVAPGEPRRELRGDLLRLARRRLTIVNARLRAAAGRRGRSRS